ncbi:hypothetical protein RUM44_006332 [Polyplax serrata]|uniref:Uncharacterized protein n=1 Tax=Polyplax serrata TaxID=468196 RepID=A0ABR1AJC3_POLSC
MDFWEVVHRRYLNMHDIITRSHDNCLKHENLIENIEQFLHKKSKKFCQVDRFRLAKFTAKNLLVEIAQVNNLTIPRDTPDFDFLQRSQNEIRRNREPTPKFLRSALTPRSEQNLLWFEIKEKP